MFVAAVLFALFLIGLCLIGAVLLVPIAIAALLIGFFNFAGVSGKFGYPPIWWSVLTAAFAVKATSLIASEMFLGEDMGSSMDTLLIQYALLSAMAAIWWILREVIRHKEETGQPLFTKRPPCPKKSPAKPEKKIVLREETPPLRPLLAVPSCKPATKPTPSLLKNPRPSREKSSLRIGWLILAILFTAFAFPFFLIGLVEPFVLFANSFFGIFAAMFLLLAFSPKDNPCILGMKNGIPKRTFVICCTILAFLMPLISNLIARI